jgi:hypothetical protein
MSRLDALQVPVKQPRFGTNAVRFLQLLYPQGAWVLTAIVPDGGRTTTATFTDPQRAREFIAEHNGDGENLYYSINPTKRPLQSKASKQDIAEVVYLHVDADPRDEESPAQAKARIRQVLETFPQRPTFEVDSGNGLQLLWQLENPIKLSDGEAIKPVEARNHALAEVFGADPATRNIDRIFRLPGTTNYPNRRKRKLGRVECKAKLVAFKDAVYRRKCFPARVEPEAARSDSRAHDQTGSGFGWRFFCDCKARGWSFEQAWEAIFHDHDRAGEWAHRTELRELVRTWERAKPIRFTDVEPKQHDWQPTFTAKQLQTMEFEPLKYIVPDWLVEGLTLFVGRPKIGKSFLMMLIADAVAHGIGTLGGADCERGDVLYCALEDNQRRLQARLRNMRIENWSRHLHFQTVMPRLDEGGIEFIREWISSVRRPRLAIIDAFVRVRPPRSQRDSSQYSEDYSSLLPLHTLAHNHPGLAIVVVHHDRKAKADDPFDAVSGTLGLNAVADSLLALYRDESGTIVLHTRGRDVEECAKAVRFDKATCRWKMLGDVAEIRRSQERTRIITAMQAIGAAASPSEIAREADSSANKVTKMLARMARDGLIRRTTHGKYSLDHVS